MFAKIPWAVLAAGAVSAAVFAEACAVGTSGDCAENGTCAPEGGVAPPPAGGTGREAGGDVGADFDSALASLPEGAADDGGPAESGRQVPTDAGEDAAGEPIADSASIDAPNGDASAEAAADADAGPACDPKQSPSEAPCVIDELYGVFVSPSGSDADSGTRAQPLRTVTRGMALATARGKRVYVCAGTYAESLAVTVSNDGASVFGGLDCATWSYSAANRVIVAPAQAGYALELDGLLMGATFEDIEFDAHDAVSPGESSVAVFALSSQNVALQRVVMVAGNGAGAPGSVAGDGGVGEGGAEDDGGAELSNHYAQPLDGMGATSQTGAASTTCTCPDGTSSTGGQGGADQSYMGIGQSPGGGLPSYDVPGGGAAGADMAPCNMAGAGGDGADAPLATADEPNQSSGLLSSAGWMPAAGVTGSNGQPGQGGGGGGYGGGGGGGFGGGGFGSGGGGACGGCGGAGGTPGAGGGASVALLMVESAVALVGCTFTAQDGGNGGAGGSGEVGQAGGYGGSAFRAGCQGGGGGSGAGGNGGQGGPGGLSVGIGWLSTSPLIEGSYVAEAQALAGVTLGKPGLGGASGTAGAAAPLSTGQPGVNGATGKDGTAQAVLGL